MSDDDENKVKISRQLKHYRKNKEEMEEKRKRQATQNGIVTNIIENYIHQINDPNNTDINSPEDIQPSAQPTFAVDLETSRVDLEAVSIALKNQHDETMALMSSDLGSVREFQQKYPTWFDAEFRFIKSGYNKKDANNASGSNTEKTHTSKAISDFYTNIPPIASKIKYANYKVPDEQLQHELEAFEAIAFVRRFELKRRALSQKKKVLKVCMDYVTARLRPIITPSDSLDMLDDNFDD